MTEAKIPSSLPDDLSPMMQQYLAMKQQCGDAILLFRCGDFYEMFMDDAVKAAEMLDIALTKKFIGKGNTVPLAGIPFHAVQNYVYRLTRMGCRVAVCEQMEPPQKGKKVVKRELIRTISPGTIIDADVIDGKENNFLVALFHGGAQDWGLAYVDVTTGEFRATCETGADARHTILAELGTLNPSEILLDENLRQNPDLEKQLRSLADCMITGLSPEAFRADLLPRYAVEEIWEPDMKPTSAERELLHAAASAILAYLSDNQKETLNYIKALQVYHRSRFMMIDKNTERNLDLLTGSSEGGKKNSLLGVLDLTTTAMGGRLLKQWIVRPLLDIEEIQLRQNAVGFFYQSPTIREELRKLLRSVHDLERLLGRINFGNANARDLVTLRISLEQIPLLNQLLSQIENQVLLQSALLREVGSSSINPVDLPPGVLLDPIMEVQELLQAALFDDPPLSVRDGGMIRDRYDSELDELRVIRKDGRGYIARLQEEERTKTGIPSLKVTYNKVFGYYIAITHTYKDKVPSHYIRKQTLTNEERFITPELKEFEAKVLHAEDRICELEFRLLQNLHEVIRGYGVRIQILARMLAHLDVVQSLAEAASRYGYCRPEVNTDGELSIREGRHPVLERAAVVDHFVPNDSRLDCEKEQVLIITGPNMAGKSTYIRQVALITLMAQIGSYVPAQAATIGVVDRLFSRVGASDDLARGRSTFMVEMSETANILRNASPRSLIILDEIGRGTSTFDGVSLAWAIVEYLHGLRGKGVKTLFATHYHELAALAEIHRRVANYHVQVSEENGKVRFLYRIAAGFSDHSYGIHVADLAGIPKRVTDRARKILRRLERGEHLALQTERDEDRYQVSLFSMLDEPLRARLADLEVNHLSPIEAWQVLNELAEEAKRK